ncbi:hypothetical protein BJ958_002654 [Nocardioides kongjuensis]|uniref:Uncharacterized protein n=1 Tax=Nocardioides kongjuensis TaxID=349522 RepID=A0A852RKF4_9ACTN|nr:hypothetical protein [Nocardioides kongjuensis]
MKSPTLKVASRILEAIGFDLDLRVHIDWVEHRVPRLGPFWVPNLLWHVDMPDCFATLSIPDGDGPMREWDLHNREQRKGVYEQLILHGLPQQMIRWVDGPFLVDVWDELDLPEPVRKAWKWAIVIAKEPTRPDALRFGPDPMLTASAWIRSYEPLPKRPKQPSVRFIPTRFDPRQRSAQAGGADDEGRTRVDDADSIAAVVERLVEELPTTRFPSTPATWSAGVAFARRWAELGYDEHLVALTPQRSRCVVRVAIDPFDEKSELVERLRTI